MRDGVQRLVIISILLVALSAMVIHYGAVADDRDQNKRSVAIIESTEAHLGEEVYLWATVKSVSADTIVANVGEQQIIIVAAKTTADPGDIIQVYGTIHAEDKITAQRIIVSDEQLLTRMIGISVIGLFLTIGLFLRHWRLNLRNISIVTGEP